MNHKFKFYGDTSAILNIVVEISNLLVHVKNHEFKFYGDTSAILNIVVEISNLPAHAKESQI
jgi:hypothetical protein